MLPILTIWGKMLQLKKGDPRGKLMADVFDVAKYILQKQGPMTTMKLQKLVYYCQAWSLVWDEKPLFDQRIEAWASGPVVPELYQAHKGEYQITSLREGDVGKLYPKEIDTIKAVLGCYGVKPAQWLADLTHMEAPWNDARKGYTPGDNCEKEIIPASMLEYYSSLSPDGEPV